MNQNEQLNRRTFIRSRVAEGLIAGGVAASLGVAVYAQIKGFQSAERLSSTVQFPDFDSTGMVLSHTRIRPKVHDLHNMNEFYGWSDENHAGYEIPPTGEINNTVPGIPIVNESGMDLGVSESGMQFIIDRLPETTSPIPLLYFTDKLLPELPENPYKHYMDVFKNKKLGTDVCIVKVKSIMDDLANIQKKGVAPEMFPFEFISTSLTVSAIDALYLQAVNHMHNPPSQDETIMSLGSIKTEYAQKVKVEMQLPFIFPLDKKYRLRGNQIA